MKITEAQIKRACEEYLEYGQNLGKWMWLRLNSGHAFMPGGSKAFYKIKLCPKGTADILVIRDGQPIFLEIKSLAGKISKEQLDFERLAIRNGASYRVIKSLEELQDIGLITSKR